MFYNSIRNFIKLKFFNSITESKSEIQISILSCEEKH